MEKSLSFKSLIGIIKITEEDGYITKISLVDKFDRSNNSELLIKTKQELEEYFSLKRTRFDIPIKFTGSTFQVKVWKILLTVPYGRTLTYGEVANLIGNPKASRAVGMACNKNPLMIVVPCHRIIGKNKKMVGYAYGTLIKQKLLNLESSLENGKYQKINK